jgi:anti-sigma factor RsiW
MSCPEFEQRLLTYDELDASDRRTTDAHLAECRACAEFLAALREVDCSLEAAVPARTPGARFDRVVLARTAKLRRFERPSLVPVILDFVAAAAMVLVSVFLLNDASIVFRVF